MFEWVYIGLGSNLGDRLEQLRFAVESLSKEEGIRMGRVSSVYDTAAVGPSQPRYLNAVVEIECEWAPDVLLKALKRIEQAQGRAPVERWGPRAIDLDILLWPGRVVATPHLQIPHVELPHRRFALAPLCELVPGEIHPKLKRNMTELLAELSHQDVLKVSKLF